MMSFIGFCLEIVVSWCGATLDGDIEVFFEYRHILCGFTPVLGYHDRNGNSMQKERKNGKWVQLVFGMVDFRAGELVKNSFVLVGGEERGVRYL